MTHTIHLKFKIGTQVRTAMGIRMEGVIIPHIPKSQYTDGSYRWPEANEEVSYIRWKNGTQGWLHSIYLEAIKEEENKEGVEDLKEKIVEMALKWAEDKPNKYAAEYHLLEAATAYRKALK